MTEPTDSPQAARPPEPASDKVDLDAPLRGIEPYSGRDGFAIPGFFETDQEHVEFVAWYRVGTQKDLGG